MNKTDGRLKEKIMFMITMSYMESFRKLVDEAAKLHLEAAYNEKKLIEIMTKMMETVKFYSLMV